MAAVRGKREEFSEATIFARLWEPTGNSRGLTPLLARHILRIGFSEADRQPMHDLAEKNRVGGLSKSEERELDSYIRVGDLLAILQSKARKVLRVGRKNNGHA